MTRLFGTDGIRGHAGEPPLDARTLRALGEALGRVLGRGEPAGSPERPGKAAPLGPSRDAAVPRPSHPARIVIGRDTRESGAAILGSLVDGLRAAGASVRSAGVVPTPGVSFLARSSDFDAGLMISASHNPWRDNGVKVFSSAGTKLRDALEDEIVAELGALLAAPLADASISQPPPADEAGLAARYGDWLVERGRLAGGLDGLRLVADCAHGAASGLAEGVLERLGARVELIHASPDGRNINDDCGSLHMGHLAARVRASGADAGVAFDGDADRALFVAADGSSVDGDQVLLIAADALLGAGRLRGGAVVGTVMTNFGLERALAARGLALVREAVGDRNVLERMQRDGCSLGGEQSGHVIFLDEAPTGDGLMTAIQLLAAVHGSGKPLAELAALMPRTPQVLRNVRVRSRVPLDQVDGWTDLARAWTDRLGGEGRLLVRYSGTEPLVRVMTEGDDERLVTECAEALATHLKGALGA